MATWKGNENLPPDYVESILALLGPSAVQQPNVEEDLGAWPEATPDAPRRPGQKHYMDEQLMAQNGPINALASAPPAIPPYQPLQVGTYGMQNPMPEGDLQSPSYVATPRAPMGMEQAGNINLNNRPSVWNPAGGYSSVYSMSFEKDGKHVLVPLVNDAGGIDTPDQAVTRYQQAGRHLGIFSTPEMADDYANNLHLQQQNALAR